MHLRLPGIVVTVCLLGACSSLPSGPTGSLQPPDAALQDCADWFRRLDAAIDQSGVRDAEAHRLPGYPHLRSNRLLASFADEVAGNPAKFSDWLNELRDLDRQSHDIEIGNLPAAATRELGVPDKAALLAGTRRCGNALVAADAYSVGASSRLIAASRVPDSHSPVLRALGLYPLVSIPFFDGVKRGQQQMVAEFARQQTLPFDATTMTRYAPAPAHGGVEDARTLLEHTRRNSLGIPQFSATQRDALLKAYAPAYEVGTLSDDDRIGAIVWRPDHVLAVEPAQPTVYQRVAFTRLGKNILPQLVYTIWFPRRTSSGIFDPLAGEFDGVIFRITLDGEGQPLIADSIHACGCYHKFFPGPRLKLRPAPQAHLEWAFVPAELPPLVPGARFTLRLAGGTHYVTRLRTTDSLDGIRYVTSDESSLRALTLSGEGTRSIYGPDGLIGDSKRGERFLFWPMGIASTGAMRQWGVQATAFVGSRHFDDADLFDRRFAISGD